MKWFSRKTKIPQNGFLSQPGNNHLVVALGNPGQRYQKTRHNAGWLWLDHHFDSKDYQYDKYGKYNYKTITQEGAIYCLVKPGTFMNKSGEAVRYALKYFNLETNDLIIVHDDVDLVVGDYKFSCSRGDGGHNGIKSINSVLGGNNYCRLRLGVRPLDVTPQTKADKYVLGNFRDSEIELINNVPVSALLKGA